jgi:hypothetical protein
LLRRQTSKFSFKFLNRHGASVTNREGNIKTTEAESQGDCILIFEWGAEKNLCKWAGGAGLRRRFFASGLLGFVVEDKDATATIRPIP